MIWTLHASLYDIQIQFKTNGEKLTSTCGLMTEQRPMSVPKNGKKLVVSRGITDDPNLATNVWEQLEEILKNVVVSLRLMRGNVLQSRPLGGIWRQIRRNPKTNIRRGGDKRHKWYPRQSLIFKIPSNFIYLFNKLVWQGEGFHNFQFVLASKFHILPSKWPRGGG